MLKASVLLLALWQGNMAERMEAMCTAACHGPILIAQQRLDRAAWTREVDKMIRWGATVPAAEKEPLIDFLLSRFNSSRPRPNTSKTLPEGKGRDVFQISCMSCHDDSIVAAARLDRAGWTREIDKMVSWGAYVPTARREDLLEYLLKMGS